MTKSLILLHPLFLGIALIIQVNLAQATTETTEKPAASALKDQVAPPASATPSQPEQLLGKLPELETTIGKYVEAWQKQDFKTMRGYESWEGGEELNETKYIQSFSGSFQIRTWKITKVEKNENGEYRVLVLISHNPPKEVAGMLPPGKTVNSTLIQWWKKQGDQFVHLLNAERKRLLQPSLPQPTPLLPIPPGST
ncbi:MAG: hypothetical protein BWK79_10360 [Beggiatoa sp. IS2]|nr:MAG: hypothetical protein BWK79_10360 [Beggiatoa sp. IS2]